MKQLFQKLGLNYNNGLFITDEMKWNDTFPLRTKEFFHGPYKPDAFFCINDKPAILFYKDTEQRPELFKAIWNFNESPIIFFVNVSNISVYNGYKYLTDTKTLEPLATQDYSEFCYINLLTNTVWDKYSENFSENNRVDYFLLENIKAAQKILVNKLNSSSDLANKLIGKCIFTKYLIDRNVRLTWNSEFKVLSDEDFAKILQDKQDCILFFKYLQNKFNGELFFLNDNEFSQITENMLHILQNLMLGHKIHPEYIQLSLFNHYDFSIIPVEFISNVYEMFIGEDNQADKGAYYTPVFMVDYILSNTIDDYYKKNPHEYNCKVLDPSCGSGVFLVETYRKIINQYDKLNPSVKKDPDKFKEAIKKLAKDNIFGIDKDPAAISVAAFSIYLTMLSYQSPPDIETFKFPNLQKSNFFNSDFFDPALQDNPNLTNIKFVIGNPPWKRGQGGADKPLYLSYISNMGKQLPKSSIIRPEIGGKEIAQAFLIRVNDFMSMDTICTLIIPSKTLYNSSHKAKMFRSFFFNAYTIKSILELAAIRRELFSKSNDPAIAPAAVISFGKGNDNLNKNLIEHTSVKPNKFFSICKSFIINKIDYKLVSQELIIKHDHLLKILVYGSYLDFHFLLRLQEEYDTIATHLNKDNFIERQGISCGRGKQYDSSHLCGKRFIASTDLEPCFIDYEQNSIFNDKSVLRPRDRKIFEAPVLLLKKGLTPELKSVSAILKQDAVYKDAFTGIKKINGNANNDLQNISLLLQSKLFSYYALMTFSSVGIEREQSFQDERFQFPYISSKELSNKYVEIEKLQAKQNKSAIYNIDIQCMISKHLNDIDEHISKSLSLSDEENALVDYAVEIAIPLAIRRNGYFNTVFSKINNDYLMDYVQVFTNGLGHLIESTGKYLSIEIQKSDSVIGIFFKESSDQDNKTKVTLNNEQDYAVISKISTLGIEQISQQLFIHKDIRGFEEDYFYIIKPNEKRLWHKAIAYLDMYEFTDAILRSGRDAQ